VEDTPQILRELEDIAVLILVPSQIYLTVKVVVMALAVVMHKGAHILQDPMGKESLLGCLHLPLKVVQYRLLQPDKVVVKKELSME
jgi:hypothetical protein